MNGTHLNQQPAATSFAPSPGRASKAKWLILAAALVIVLIAALSFLRRGEQGPLPPPPPVSPADVEDVLQGFGGLTPGNSPKEIEQDIQDTDLNALDAELDELERELQAL